MINEYATLLLNLTDQGNPAEPISPGYTSVTLPAALQNFHQVLFPQSTSRYYQVFLCYYYLNLLKSTKREKYVYSFDPRVTYDLSDITNYFGYNLISAPVLSNSQFPVLVNGSLTFSPQWNNNADVYTVTQVNSTESVVIYSQNQQGYLNGPNVYPNWVNAAIVSTPFTGNSSGVIPIGTTGLSMILTSLGASFTATGNKTWMFSATCPIEFNFMTQVYNGLPFSPVVANLINYNPAANDPNEIACWQQHFNPIYRFSGLLNTYVLQMQNYVS